MQKDMLSTFSQTVLAVLEQQTNTWNGKKKDQEEEDIPQNYPMFHLKASEKWRNRQLSHLTALPIPGFHHWQGLNYWAFSIKLVFYVNGTEHNKVTKITDKLDLPTRG